MCSRFPPPGAAAFLGDIAISFEHARRQAAEYGHGIGQEIEILILHGVLHLLGMDHERDRGQHGAGRKPMARTPGIAAGLIDRVKA